MGVSEEVSAETYKLKKAVTIQIENANDFRKQIYLLIQDLLSLSGGQEQGQASSANQN